MAAPRRVSRYRVATGNPIEHAWDQGLPPPADASDPDRRDEVLQCVFLRWCEHKPRAGRHPHLSQWLDALARSRGW